MDNLWRFENVTKSGNRKPRLDNLSLAITKGITAIMGFSAAGKTSLLNLLTGFEKPDQGHVVFLDDRTDAIPLFWAPQNEGLWPHLNAAQHLEMVLPNPTPASIQRWLSDFDIADKTNALPDELSLGERARLSVARCLASEARILIMDEPLVHVDLSRRRKYWRIIERHIRTHDVSLIFASHQPREVLGLAEQLLFLKNGSILYQGSADELYHQPPDETSAWCLGEINWFNEAEARLWLNQGSHDPQGYRPERIHIAPAPDSPLVVESASFHGSIAEISLRHIANGQTRLFYSRPSQLDCSPGMSVRIKRLEPKEDSTEATQTTDHHSQKQDR